MSINLTIVQLKNNFNSIKLPEATGLGGLTVLGAPADLGDADEILLGEDGVVEGEQRGPLPLREGIGEK